MVREASPTAARAREGIGGCGSKSRHRAQILNERDPGDIDRLLATLKGTDALVIADDAEFTADRARIAELALKMHLPTISGLKELAEAGGLIAYGASFGELYRRAASHVHKILQGDQSLRPSGGAAGEIRTCGEHANGKGYRPRNSPISARARRRGDRIGECPLLAHSGHRLVRCTCLLLTQSGHRD